MSLIASRLEDQHAALLRYQLLLAEIEAYRFARAVERQLIGIEGRERMAALAGGDDEARTRRTTKIIDGAIAGAGFALERMLIIGLAEAAAAIDLIKADIAGKGDPE
jgi:hypothetical protein